MNKIMILNQSVLDSNKTLMFCSNKSVNLIKFTRFFQMIKNQIDSIMGDVLYRLFSF